MKSRRWLVVFFKIFLTVLIFFGIFNYIINPYNTFNHNFYFSFNYMKTKVISDRMTKFYELKHVQPKTILMGSSRIGMIPTIYVENYVDKPIYNLSLAGSSIYEQTSYLEYALNNMDITTIIWGLDFFGINPVKNIKNKENEDRVTRYINYDDYLTSLISAKAIKHSLSTIKYNFQNKKKTSKYYADLQYKETIENTYSEQEILQNIEQTLETYTINKTFLTSEEFKKPENINICLEMIDKIVKLAQKKDVKLYILVNPVYKKHLDLYEKLGLSNTYIYWKDKLADITSYYDFLTYNSITNNHLNFRDSAHIKPDLTPMLFGRIFHNNEDNIPKDFGVFVEKKLK